MKIYTRIPTVIGELQSADYKQARLFNKGTWAYALPNF